MRYSRKRRGHALSAHLTHAIIVPLNHCHCDASLPNLQLWGLCVGKFAERDLPHWSGRDFKERGFTVGIGGYVFLYDAF